MIINKNDKNQIKYVLYRLQLCEVARVFFWLKNNRKGEFCLKQCPICKNLYNEPSAISRTDNKTEICSRCGTKQALEVFMKYEKSKKVEK